MKNVILGMTGAVLIIWMTVISLGVYRLTTEKAVLEDTLSRCMKQVMQEYFGSDAILDPGRQSEMTAAASAAAEDQLVTTVAAEIPGVIVTVEACDMEKGLIAAEAEETINLPAGVDKTLYVRRVILVDYAKE